MRSALFFTLALSLRVTHGIRIVQSNDDGWAEINLRTFFDVLNAAGHQVILSGPADNQSGTGSSDQAPKVVGEEGCQFDSCAPGSPAVGANRSDIRLNYVNSFPVTSIKAGIDVIAPRLWNGAKPELALTGPNVGSNLAFQTQFSGTVGAATYAAKTAKIPAIAFSGRSGQPTAWNAPTPLYSKVYADLALNVTTTIINSGPPYLPNNTFLNVNFAKVDENRCNSSSMFKYIFTRIDAYVPLLSGDDAGWCGDKHLPQETFTIFDSDACYVTISPGDATDKTTVNGAKVQQEIIEKLKPILSCLPKDD